MSAIVQRLQRLRSHAIAVVILANGVGSALAMEINVVPSEQRVYGQPGEMVMGVFTVHNYSGRSLVVNPVVVNTSPGWTCWLSPTTLPLDIGGEANVYVYVTVSSTARSGDSSSMEIQFWNSTGYYYRSNYLTTLVGLSSASPTVITSFPGNGCITWTNSMSGGAYCVEWAPSLTNYWRRSWQDLQYVEGQTNYAFASQVPMFYRIVQIPLLPSGMVLVDAGEFLMGDPYAEGENSERPVHTVKVDAFWIERYEVTWDLWSRVRNWGLSNGYTDLAVGVNGWSGSHASSERGHPAVQLSWYDAVKWCNARSEMEGLSPAYYTTDGRTSVYRMGSIQLSDKCVDWNANGYRLPTEAEREKAARGNLVGNHFPWRSFGGGYANHIDGTKGNYIGSGDLYEAGTTRIGYYNGSQGVTNGAAAYLPGVDMANPLSLYDMAGNVGEWCWDYFQYDYYGNSPLDNPKGPVTGWDRAIRDGSWKVAAVALRCSARFSSEPGNSSTDVGLRCVRR